MAQLGQGIHTDGDDDNDDGGDDDGGDDDGDKRKHNPFGTPHSDISTTWANCRLKSAVVILLRLNSSAFSVRRRASRG